MPKFPAAAKNCQHKNLERPHIRSNYPSSKLKMTGTLPAIIRWQSRPIFPLPLSLPVTKSISSNNTRNGIFPYDCLAEDMASSSGTAPNRAYYISCCNPACQGPTGAVLSHLFLFAAIILPLPSLMSQEIYMCFTDQPDKYWLKNSYKYFIISSFIKKRRWLIW